MNPHAGGSAAACTGDRCGTDTTGGTVTRNSTTKVNTSHYRRAHRHHPPHSLSAVILPAVTRDIGSALTWSKLSGTTTRLTQRGHNDSSGE